MNHARRIGHHCAITSACIAAIVLTLIFAHFAAFFLVALFRAL